MINLVKQKVEKYSVDSILNEDIDDISFFVKEMIFIIGK